MSTQKTFKEKIYNGYSWNVTTIYRDLCCDVFLNDSSSSEASKRNEQHAV